MAVSVHRLHTNVGFVSRATGGAGSVSTAAYNERTAYYDERQGRTFDYSADAVPPLASGILAPDHFKALDTQDPERFWNDYEDAETEALAHRYRADPERALDAIENARIATKGRFTLSNALPADQIPSVVEAILREAVVDAKQCAVHYAVHADDGNTHVHFMIALRKVKADGGFGGRIFRTLPEMEAWSQTFRETVARVQNDRLEQLGIEHHVEHRSNVDLGLDLKATVHLDHATAVASTFSRDADGVGMSAHNARVQRKNAEVITADPGQVVKLLLVGHRDEWGRSEGRLCRDDATVTLADIHRTVLAVTGGRDDVAEIAVAKLLADERLVSVGMDGRGEERFTTREYLDVEKRMLEAARTLAGRDAFRVDEAARDRHIADKYAWLNTEQQAALRHMTGPSSIALVQGRAGVGKTTIMSAAREVWEAEGYQVRGAAIAWKAAKLLEKEAGIESASIAAIVNAERQMQETGRCGRPELLLKKGTVLVIDEAGMGDVRSVEILTAAAARAGAKLVAIGDTAQYAAIGAGAGFDALQKEVGAAEIKTIMRQTADAEDVFVAQGMTRAEALERVKAMTWEERRAVVADNAETAKGVNFGTGDVWRRHAAKALADWEIRAGLDEWHKRGYVVETETKADQIAAMVDRYFDLRDRREQLAVYAFTNADVAALNAAIRSELQRRGEVGADQTVIGGTAFAVGDRVMFTAGDPHGRIIGGGVVNGDSGRIIDVLPGIVPVDRESGKTERVRTDVIRVQMDDGREVAFGAAAWTAVAHNWATTHYKSQGATVDGTVLVLADKHLRADGAYVALTRSKQDTYVYYAREEFASYDDLARSMSRAPAAHSAQDIVRGHGVVAERVQAIVDAGRGIAEALHRADDRRAEHAGTDSDELSPTATARIGQLVEKRREAARAIVLDVENKAASIQSARHAGIAWARIEELAGLRLPVRTEAQIKAEDTVRDWHETSKTAQALWNEIKATHPGATSKDHPRYAEFDTLREKRDEIASTMAADAALYKGVFRHLASPPRLVTTEELRAGQKGKPAFEALPVSWKSATDQAEAVAKRRAEARAGAEQARLDSIPRPSLIAHLAKKLASIGGDVSRAAEAGLALTKDKHGTWLHNPRIDKPVRARADDVAAAAIPLVSKTPQVVQVQIPTKALTPDEFAKKQAATGLAAKHGKGIKV
ncbi:AAA family ATPase [Microvirga pudoricolor]|uniref:AAA family ATPase n=1 Tax=Microvirga pudoricolor TaxID=2778729 RepID=UPI00194DEDFF|nr:AAA family ATPase [Microvirga pudoricolor]MBM6595347.1 AAA family ATPase [Microvirga pudoricolor]